MIFKWIITYKLLIRWQKFFFIHPLPLLVGYNSLWVKQLGNQSYNKTNCLTIAKQKSSYIYKTGKYSREPGMHPPIYETVSFYQLAAHLLDLPLHLSEILIISEFVTGASQPPTEWHFLLFLLYFAPFSKNILSDSLITFTLNVRRLQYNLFSWYIIPRSVCHPNSSSRKGPL